MTKKQIGIAIGREIAKKKLSYYRITADTGIHRNAVKAITAGDTAYTIDALLGLVGYLSMGVTIE